MKKRSYKLFMRLLKDDARYFAGAGAMTAVAIFLGFLTPAVLAEVLDHVLSGLPSRMPAFLSSWVEAQGGRAWLTQNLWAPGLAIALIALLVGVSSYLKARWIAVGSENAARTLKDRLYAHLQELPFSYHSASSTGDLVQRSTSDVDTVRRFLAMQLLGIVDALLMLGFALALLLPISTRITLISLAVMPVMLVFSWKFFSLIIKAFRKADEAEARMTTVLQENLTGVRVVRAFGQAQREIEKFDETNRENRTLLTKLNWLHSFYWSGGDLMGQAQTLMTLMFCLAEVRAGRMSVGDLVVFTSYIGMLIWPVRNMGRVLSQAGRAMVSLERIDEVLRQKPEEDRADAGTPDLRGDVVFDDVSFHYDGGEDVLRGLSFTVKAGQTAAILGSTGSGKSTIALLLQRLYEPQSGTITISGHDIRQVKRKHLRSRVGLVLQEPFLYSRTLRENLRMGAHAASDEALTRAARDAQAEEFILQSQKGWDTLVGERGVTLSGGQKQRAAIARTLLKDNDVLIFDDSLSAVDTQTDELIRKALRERSRGVTTIIISHRIVTLSQADKIIVLEDGRVADEGTHEELIARPGLYRRINQIQAGLEDEDDAAREQVPAREAV
ncbi:MAG TPA: ABC transporter ATP-binding protein [Candidatus Limnocylindria bacterium]|nr:ABC transporter ATP-binding protein [Candidatus Limnocylindria bacterium]